jgi:hypothetical protein
MRVQARQQLTFRSSPIFARQHSIFANLCVMTRNPLSEQAKTRNEANMLWTLFVILLVLWLVGVVSSYTLGGFIHLLLVLAVLALVFQLISDRRTTTV